MIVTIDGPAGSGKSTVARRLAARLKLPYLDTGAMYRAVAYKVLHNNVSLDDEAAIAETARHARLDVDCHSMPMALRLDGQDVSNALRTMDVGGAAAVVAAIQSVRDLMVDKQRAIGLTLGSLVSEGRDQGSTVFPSADVKFIIDADVEVRARRRLEELHAAGSDATYDDVIADLKRRDLRDAVRWQPLLESGAAIVVDTTHMTLDHVVDELERQVRERRSGNA